MIIGLTGGIGSGKSIAGKYFNELGIDTIDADDVAKNILDDNSKAKQLFLKCFGDEFLDQDNKINRDLLRAKIFIDIEKKNKLESIIHPIVKEEIASFISKSDSIYKIIIVPLIFETNSQDFYEKIIVIDCDEDMQIERASQRDDKSEQDIINIMKNQASREERNSIADNIILNDSTLNNLKENILKVHQKLLGIHLNE
tara:strand:+ start:64 stop:660 length:597 start_codon:yes stop_codon:yes gene_type:complete